MLYCALEELGPIRGGPDHVPDVDVIEVVLRECPGLVDVIDFEADVGRHEAWLDRGDIDARDFCGGMLVGEIASEYVSERGARWFAKITYITQAPVPQPTSRTR